MNSKRRFICFITIFCLMLAATVLCGFKDQPRSGWSCHCDVNWALQNADCVVKVEKAAIRLEYEMVGTCTEPDDEEDFRLVYAVCEWRVVEVYYPKGENIPAVGDIIRTAEVLRTIREPIATPMRLDTTRCATPIWSALGEKAVLILRRGSYNARYGYYFPSRYNDVLRIEEDGSLTTPGLPGAAYFPSITALRRYIRRELPSKQGYYDLYF